MVVDSLYFCVGLTILMVSAGMVLLHLSIRFRIAAVTGDRLAAIDLEYHARNFESLAVILLFCCWMPCSNAAWITETRCEMVIQRLAELTKQNGSQLAEISHGIADENPSMAVVKNYQVTLPGGAIVSWASAGNGDSGNHNSRPAMGMRLGTGTGQYPLNAGSGYLDTTTGSSDGLGSMRVSNDGSGADDPAIAALAAAATEFLRLTE